MVGVDIAQEGVVNSFTTVRIAPPGQEVPYSLAYADFVPKARLFGRVVGDVAVGGRVTLVESDVPGELYTFVSERGN